ncbi:MAG: macro domain-containing protein [Candidatus Tectomicrobia bacterium]|nr:macro domain-containing protein [Candidatus Tectomicrobia bacterium]
MNQKNMTIHDAKMIPVSEDVFELVLETSRGNLFGLLHFSEEKPYGIIWAPGQRGSLNGPAGELFADLSYELADLGISSLRLCYRFPQNLDECLLDLMASLTFLGSLGIQDFFLVGHAEGAALAMTTAVMSPLVKGVVGMSNPNFIFDLVEQISPRPLLLLHGGKDRFFPQTFSEELYKRAKEPKELVIYPEGGYALWEVQNEVKEKVREWLLGKMGEEIPETPPDRSLRFPIESFTGSPKEILLLKGNIALLEVDAIVCPTGHWLDLGGPMGNRGVGGIIIKYGGRSIQDELHSHAPLFIGEAVATGAGDLKARYVIHAITGGVSLDDQARSAEDTIIQVVRNSLLRAEERGVRSLASPPLGTGDMGFPLERAAQIMVKMVVEHLQGPSSIEKMILAMPGEGAYRAFEGQLRAFFQ